MDYSVSIGCSEGRVLSPGRGGGRRGNKGRGGVMIALPRRVPSYTTNLTTPEATAMPELWQWSGMLRRQWRRMPEVVVVLELGVKYGP